MSTRHHHRVQRNHNERVVGSLPWARKSTGGVNVSAHVDQAWAEVTNAESLVYNLYTYRELRLRQLRGLTTEAEDVTLAGIEPVVRGSTERPIIYPRFKCSLPGTLVVSAHGIRVTHAIALVDMSATGARVKSIPAIELNAEVELLIPRQVLGDEVFDWHGRVVWAAADHVGIRFLSSSETQP